MSYRVVEFFTDLTDNNYAYHTGDKFPRDGVVVGEGRLSELSSANNKLGRAVIERVDDEPKVAEETPVDDATEGEVKYTEDDLENMTTKEIKALAAECGYKITKNAKFDVIAQFLKAQKKR